MTPMPPNITIPFWDSWFLRPASLLINRPRTPFVHPTMDGNQSHQQPFNTQENSMAKDDADDCTKPLISGHDADMNKKKEPAFVSILANACFMKWTREDLGHVLVHHPIPFVFSLSLLYFMGVEYTLSMVSPSSPPFDIGFELTRGLHGLLAPRPAINSLLAALNTVFVGMQTMYILWAWFVEGRPRATIAALFMFTCRGILGYATQLPLPQEFLGSGVDFPVGNVSFFLFFSGHVGGSVIASIDMRRMGRHGLALLFDTLNVLQVVRLLVTRGHYTIDLAAGVGAGILCDSLAGRYQEAKKISHHYLSYIKSNASTANR